MFLCNEVHIFRTFLLSACVSKLVLTYCLIDGRLSEKCKWKLTLPSIRQCHYVARQSKSVKIQQPTVQGEVQQETAIKAVKGANKSFQKNKQGMPQTKLCHAPGNKMCG